MRPANKGLRTFREHSDYYMEDANIPTDSKERMIYFRCARSFLADRLAELYALTKRIEP